MADDEWRDKLGKLVEPPRINFAGKYFVAVHSGGTGCSYYTTTDLSSGQELDLLKDFGAAEPPPKMREGYPYVTDLVTRAKSRLVVAQFHLDSPRGNECRERAFILEGEKITPVVWIRSHVAYIIETMCAITTNDARRKLVSQLILNC